MDKDFERQAHFLIAKDPDGNAVLVRATSDGRLMTDGAGGSGPAAEYFNVIGGISAEKSGDTLIFEAGEGIQIVPDQINHKITFAVTGGGSGGDIPIGTLDQAGIVRLSSTLGEDETTAATPKLVTEVGAKALYAVKVAETDATLLEKGRVQLYKGTDLDNDELAATASAVYSLMQYVLDNVIPHADTHLPDGSDPLPIATVLKYGLVKLSNAVTNDSKEVAATAYAVKTVMDAATKVASLTEAGQVKLSSALDSNDETLAATSSAIKVVYDIAKRVASLNQIGQVKLSKELELDSDEVAATASAIKQLYTIATREASTATPGQVKLDTAVNSTSTTTAATSSAVKVTYDLAAAALPSTGGILKGEGSIFKLEGATHVYQSFYPRGLSNGRKAYMGFPDADATDFNINNEDAGNLRLYCLNGNIRFNDKYAALSLSQINTALTKVDAFYAQINGLTSSNIYYVDGVTGNNSNNGTSQTTPFKTIMAAVSKIKTDYGNRIDGSASVKIKGDQTYAENITLTGIVGGGSILFGRWDNELQPVISGSFTIRNCTVKVDVGYINCLSTFQSTGNTFVACTSVYLTNTAPLDGFFAQQGGTLHLINCMVSGRSNGIRCSGAKVISQTTTGSTNTVGLFATLGGEIVKISTQPAGTTAESQTLGGLIR